MRPFATYLTLRLTHESSDPSTVTHLLERIPTRALRANQVIQLNVCGILFGRPDGSLDLKPLSNTSERPSAYRMDSNELREAKVQLKGEKFPFLGTYHSHVRGYPYPSKGDMKSASPGELMLILDANSFSLGLWRNPPRGQPDGWTSIPIWCSAIRVSPQMATIQSRHLQTLCEQSALRAKAWIPWWDHDEFSRGIRVMNRFGGLF